MLACDIHVPVMSYTCTSCHEYIRIIILLLNKLQNIEKQEGSKGNLLEPSTLKLKAPKPQSLAL